MSHLPEIQRTLRYPDFLGIGAQRAGTSWLHRMLRGHPDLWLPPLKEIHYFDVRYSGRAGAIKSAPRNMDQRRSDVALKRMKSGLDRGRATSDAKIQSLSLIGRRELTDDWYGRIFQPAPDGARCGEITPSYALLPEQGIEHILRLQPRVKILFQLRDPIDRCWSALRLKGRRSKSGGREEFLRLASGRKFLSQADYVQTIERYRRYIPAKDFLTLYFDDIAERPKELLEAVCRFLEVDYARGKFKKLDEASNAAPAEALEPEIYDSLKTRLAPIYERLLTLDHPIVERWYRRHYRQM